MCADSSTALWVPCGAAPERACKRLNSAINGIRSYVGAHRPAEAIAGLGGKSVKVPT
jgi:hypothetical protein